MSRLNMKITLKHLGERGSEIYTGELDNLQLVELRDILETRFKLGKVI